MHTFTVASLVLILIAVPVVAGQSALSFAVELATGALAAAVPFYAVLFRTSETPRPIGASRFGEPAIEEILLGLAAPPLAAGATVACVGRLLGVTGSRSGFVSILGASVGELLALRAWELDLPEWMKILAVPAITSLGATLAFNRLVRSSL
ncbi:hypothetical protein JW848_05175 [Candidatus Bipolaricaulota bacterium]|nr:hypothetical protein [Candidatus Bipolaricaulota bacterium]